MARNIGIWLGQQYPATKKAAGHAELLRAAQTAPYDPLQPTYSKPPTTTSLQ